MTKNFAWAVLFAAMATPAAAADMSASLEAPVSSDWSGFYLGAHAGGGKSIVDWTFAGLGTTADHEGDGAFGGVQAGYNFQSGNWVFGAEADISASGIKGDTACPNPVYTCSSDAKWLSTVRGRVGYSFDNLLVYGTGGLGIGRFEMSTDDGAGDNGGDSRTKTGWVAGAGVEYAISPRWSVKAEYMYYNFGSARYGVYPTQEADIDQRFHTGKIGVNFRF
ncbi:outer membrane protein [Ciceribacter thiooxidans]|uniref:Outer membrane protein n=1 Tax=Ciceribacter thiooxidans TaxID=1969821 RepID=A0ABV7I333_9HYPH|nr:outer membrane protein [Ciceribacter thiooxidans]